MKTKRMFKPLMLDKRTARNIFKILEPNFFQQGMCYKSEYDFNKALPNEIVYIPEYGYVDGEPNEIYTKQDFIDIAKEHNISAYDLFDMVDWQHPETLAEEIEEVLEGYDND